MKNKIFHYLSKGIFLLLITIGLTSCLKSNLEDLPAFEDNFITDVKFDFRYKDANDVWVDGQPTVKVVTLTVGNKVIDKTAGTITCTLTVPAASGSFTADIRNQVSLSSIVGKFNISTGAAIAPKSGAPVLGIPGDFSAARQYEVTAASGASKTWTVTVTALNKP